MSLVVGTVFCGFSLANEACGLSLEANAGANDASATDGASTNTSSSSSSSSGALPSSSSSSGSTSSSGAPPCDLDDADAGCIDESRGVFVDAAATPPDGGADGSRGAPYATIQAGVQALSLSKGKRFVFVCAGTYAENVTVSGAEISLIGGLDCTSWQPGNTPTRVSAARPLTVSSAGTLVEVRSMTFSATAGVDGTADAPQGGSSIAAIVYDGASLRARDSVFEAGAGGNGRNGAAGGGNGVAGGNGGNGSNQGGTAGRNDTCGAHGGKGGDDVSLSTDGSPNPADHDEAGRRGCNVDEAALAVCIHANSTCGEGAAGFGGAPRPAQNTPAAAGVFQAGTWTPSDGPDGSNGFHGGGGGGGGYANVADDEAGGGGGAGGCGGQGGRGGGGGGASIAVLIHGASFEGTASTLRTGNAGNGGKGGKGTNGGDGGAKGNGELAGCDGGSGGAGAGGNGGGGGSAGVNAGLAYFVGATILWNGTAPDALTPTGIELGSAGSRGAGGDQGTGGSGDSGNDGKNGYPGPTGHDTTAAAALALD